MSLSLPNTLPLFPLGAALIPGMELPLHIFEARYRRLLRDRRNSEPVFGVILIRAGREVADRPEIFRTGTAASLVDATEHRDGRFSILVRGGRRFRVVAEDWSTGYLTADVDWLGEPAGDDDRCVELAVAARERWRKFVVALARLIGDRDEAEAIADQIVARLPDPPNDCGYAILGQLPVPATTRQRLLEIATTENRLQALIDLLETERRLTTAFGNMPTFSYTTNRSIEVN
jgi:Lon protease-like protein